MPFLSANRRQPDSERLGGTKMGVVFTRKLYEVHYVDTLQLPDGYGTRLFTAEITVKEGEALKALQGGRIIYFHMFDDDHCTLCLYENAEWKIEIPQDDTIAEFAMEFFVTHWNSVHRKAKGQDLFCSSVVNFESDHFPSKSQLAELDQLSREKQPV